MTKKQIPSGTPEIASLRTDTPAPDCGAGHRRQHRRPWCHADAAGAADRTPDEESDGTLDAQPFFGKRQSGVVDAATGRRDGRGLRCAGGRSRRP